MITHEQYMENSEKLHHDYFSQFIFPAVRDYVKSNYTIDFLKQCYIQDKNLNNLGGTWLKAFDRFAERYKSDFSKINYTINKSRSWSCSMGTCAIKAYMRIYAGLTE